MDDDVSLLKRQRPLVDLIVDAQVIDFLKDPETLRAGHGKRRPRQVGHQRAPARFHRTQAALIGSRLLSTLGQIGTDVAKTQPEAPVLFVIGRVAGMYPQIAELDAALCEGAGMAAYA